MQLCYAIAQINELGSESISWQSRFIKEEADEIAAWCNERNDGHVYCVSEHLSIFNTFIVNNPNRFYLGEVL